MQPEPPRLERRCGDDATVHLSGSWTLQRLADIVGRIDYELHAASDAATCDLRELTGLDRFGALLIARSWRDRMPELVGAQDKQRLLEACYERLADRAHEPLARDRGCIDLVGAVVRAAGTVRDHARIAAGLIGQLALDTLYLLRHPSETPWREISATVHHSGTRALGITALVGALIGVVISYLVSMQLQLYGAEGRIVWLLGLGVTRELGPLVAALIIAGRSGSAMTAELGVMKLTQEVDAMQVLGIPRSIRLLLPKVIAMAFIMPLLVVWTDVMALLGGALSAAHTIGMSVSRFVAKLPSALPAANVWIGASKGIVFGVLIALTACHFAMRVQPNTSSLARQTTNSVVVATVEVIAVDALFAIALRGVGLR